VSSRHLHVTGGGVMSYAPDLVDQFRRAAGYVDRHGVGVPKDTPAEIIETLNKEINAGLADSAESLPERPRRDGWHCAMSGAEAPLERQHGEPLLRPL
jgi:hypothetical protein